VVDEQMLQGDAKVRGDAERALEHFDSYTFLEGIGAAIITGATGNNLRDLRILLAEGSAK
jgi:glycerate 2-kinase